jgi:hypothetical protein
MSNSAQDPFENEERHELTLGRARSVPPPQRPRPAPEASSQVDAESPRLADRCRAKADAARWAAERERRIRDRDDDPDRDAPSDPEMKAWADALVDAYHWASLEDASNTLDVQALDDVGGGFETLAVALDLVGALQDRRNAMERALPLIAESQSAVRRALRRIGMSDDRDQFEAFEWVIEEAARHRVFVKRFLKADDLADPAIWPERIARIEALSGGGDVSKRHVELLERLRQAVRRLENSDSSEEDWKTVLSALSDLIASGVAPSHREVRDLLLPHIDDMPEGLDPPGDVTLVLRAIDRFLSTRGVPSAKVKPAATTPEIREAARLLEGRSAVLIGGLRRPSAQKALQEALGLAELNWIGTREHQSIRGFEAAIVRPEVAVVLLAIRWSSHAFGDVKTFCDQSGKPLVRLPGGYNPSQVAAQILAQCSGQLEP